MQEPKWVIFALRQAVVKLCAEKWLIALDLNGHVNNTYPLKSTYAFNLSFVINYDKDTLLSYCSSRPSPPTHNLQSLCHAPCRVFNVQKLISITVSTHQDCILQMENMGRERKCVCAMIISWLTWMKHLFIVPLMRKEQHKMKSRGHHQPSLWNTKQNTNLWLRHKCVRESTMFRTWWWLFKMSNVSGKKMWLVK